MGRALKKKSKLPPGTVYLSKKGRGKRRINHESQDVCFDCGKPGRHTPQCEWKLNSGKYLNKGRDGNASQLQEAISGEDAPQVHPPQTQVASGEDVAEVHPPQAQAAPQARVPGAIPPMDKDGGFLTDFLTRSWEEREATLPSLHKLRPKTPLDRSKWPTWKYTLPDASLSFGAPPDPDAFLFGGCDVYVWCPFTFFSHFIDVNKLSCPACGSNEVTSDGWSKSFLPIVSLGGQWPLLRVRRLRHLKCPRAAEGYDSTGFSSLDETLVASWYPAVLLSLLPFRKDGKSYVSLDATTYAREMQHIAPHDAARDVLSALRDMWLQRRQKALEGAHYYMEQYAEQRVAGAGREAFQSTTTVTSPAMTRPIEHRVDEPVDDVLNEETPVFAAESDSVPRRREWNDPSSRSPKTRRNILPCPHCGYKNRRHDNASAASCALFQFYKKGNFCNSSGVLAYERAIVAFRLTHLRDDA